MMTSLLRLLRFYFITRPKAMRLWSKIRIDQNLLEWRVNWLYPRTMVGYSDRHKKLISLGPSSKQIELLLLDQVASIRATFSSGPWIKRFADLCYTYGFDPNEYEWYNRAKELDRNKR